MPKGPVAEYQGSGRNQISFENLSNTCRTGFQKGLHGLIEHPVGSSIKAVTSRIK
jgi:hypothetical protein